MLDPEYTEKQKTNDRTTKSTKSTKAKKRIAFRLVFTW